MTEFMDYGDETAAIEFTGEACVLSDEAKEMLAIHLSHREGWTFSSVKIPEEWCEVDALGALLQFDKIDLMLCAFPFEPLMFIPNGIFMSVSRTESIF